MPLPERELIILGSSYESITIDDAAGGVGLTPPDAALFAYCSLETAQIRVTVDGTAASSTVGHIREVGDVFWLENKEELRLFRGSRTGGTSGVLKVTYYK